PGLQQPAWSTSQGGHQYRLDGVHAVFRLVENDRGGAFEYLIGNLHGSDAELLLDLLANNRLGIVECRQTVHEAYVRIARSGHECGVDLIRQEQLDPLGPFFLWLAHGQPDVGIIEIHPRYRAVNVVGNHDSRAGGAGNLLGLLADIGRRPATLWRTQTHVHAHLGAADQQAVAHVVGRIANEHIGDVPQWLFRTLLHGQEVGKHLGG